MQGLSSPVCTLWSNGWSLRKERPGLCPWLLGGELYALGIASLIEAALFTGDLESHQRVNAGSGLWGGGSGSPGLPGWWQWQRTRLPMQVRHERCRFDPWVGRTPWRRARQPTPVCLPGEPHGQRSLAGYGPQPLHSQTCPKRLSAQTRTGPPALSATKAADLNSNVSVITLTVNDLNTPIHKSEAGRGYIYIYPIYVTSRNITSNLMT